MQKTDLHLLLQISKLAEKYSDDVYTKLYKLEEDKKLNLSKNCSKINPLELFGENDTPSRVDGEPMTEEELEASKEEWAQIKEAIIKNYVPHFYNEKEEKANFKKMQKNFIRNLKSKLPKSILDEVADVRVLALNYSTKKVKEKIKNYCEEQMLKVNQAFENYNACYSKMLSSEQNLIFDEKMHDSQITDCKKNDKEFELYLNSCYSNVYRIVFTEYKIIKMDKDLINLHWLYDEIYKTQNGYELHILLCDDKDKPIDFILLFSFIRLDRIEDI